MRNDLSLKIFFLHGTEVTMYSDHQNEINKQFKGFLVPIYMSDSKKEDATFLKKLCK